MSEQHMKSIFRRLASNTTDTSSKSSDTNETRSAADSTSDPDGGSKTNEKLQGLEEHNKKLLEQLEETQDKYRRALAETENVRQRLNKQIQDAKIFGIQGFCKDLLEVADILSKATESIKKEELQANPSLKLLYEGLQLTESQLGKVFTRHGLLLVCPKEGEKFDPNCHEALFQQPAVAGKTPGTVAIVNKVGYMLHSRTLRPAVVGVFSSS